MFQGVMCVFALYGSWLLVLSARARAPPVAISLCCEAAYRLPVRVCVCVCVCVYVCVCVSECV